MKRLSLSYSVITLLLCFVILASSCTTNKKITYFQDTPDSLYLSPRNLTGAPYRDPQIQANDILQISILTLDPQVNNILASANSASFAVQPGSTSTVTNTPTVSGFLVDNNGAVELPVVGKIRVSGMSTAAARDSIHHKVSLYYRDPVVNVRFANFNITVLGEVSRPATYIVPSEKVSILDAIGMAGDLTIFGKRENVLLIRDSSGTKQMIRFDLNSSSTLLSPYFYLRQGDVVYVEPSKSKVASTDANKAKNFTLLASGLSLLVVIFTRL